MRQAILHGVLELARRDERVVFIGSDITKASALVQFSEEIPERFFMEGVSEQHLVGMAAGLAMSGKIPFINTIGTFLTRRCFEQIAIDLCLHEQPVRLIGSGGGAVYAPLGGTHMALEDIAILRPLPHLAIVACSDAEEMERFLPATLEYPGPIYIRLAKGGDEIVPWNGEPFRIGRAYRLRAGGDALLVGTGITTLRALRAAEHLAERGLAVGVVHVPCIKPFDADTLLAAARGTRAVISVEEGTVTGGLGSAVAELLAEAGWAGAPRFARLGFPERFLEHFGSQDAILEKYGLTPEAIAARTLELAG